MPLMNREAWEATRWPSMKDLAEMEARLGRKLDQILGATTHMEAIMANDFSKLQAAVDQEDNVIDSAVTLLNGLAAIIRQTAPDQAAIDALAAGVQAKADALAQAVAANTGAAAAPPPAAAPPADTAPPSDAPPADTSAPSA